MTFGLDDLVEKPRKPQEPKKAQDDPKPAPEPEKPVVPRPEPEPDPLAPLSELGEDYDGSTPLPVPWVDHFLYSDVHGMYSNRPQRYVEAKGDEGLTVGQLRSRVSSLLVKPAVARRRAWLVKEKEAATTVVDEVATRATEEELPEPQGDVLTKDEIKRILSDRVRHGSDTASIAAARQLLATLEDEAKELTPVDPSAIAEHLCRFAGMPAADVARELGGVELVLGKVADVLHLTLPELRDHLTRMMGQRPTAPGVAKAT